MIRRLFATVLLALAVTTPTHAVPSPPAPALGQFVDASEPHTILGYGQTNIC